MNDSRESAHPREARRITPETALIVLLLAGIFVVLAAPSRHGWPGAETSSRAALFQVMESDFLQPKFASARAVQALNRVAGGFATFGGYDEFTSCVRAGGEISIANVTRIAGDTLALLGVRFLERAPESSTSPGIYISEAFWERAFHGSAAALGAKLLLHGVEYTIAGITRETSAMLAKTDVWLPVRSRGIAGESPSLRVIGELHGSMGWSQAQKQLVETAGLFPVESLQDVLATPRLIPIDRGIYFGAPDKEWIAQHLPRVFARMKRAS